MNGNHLLEVMDWCKMEKLLGSADIFDLSMCMPKLCAQMLLPFGISTTKINSSKYFAFFFDSSY
jgi:hypothetical protein